MADMTSRELDELDRICAEMMERPYEFVFVPESPPEFFRPTRNPADTCALEDWLWEQGYDVRFYRYPNGDVTLVGKELSVIEGQHETRAIALCLAVVQMEEGK